MSIPNSYNYQGIGNASNFQNNIASNFGNNVSISPYHDSIILENNKPIGINHYSEIIPISSKSRRPNSPQFIHYPNINGFVPQNVNNQFTNPYQFNNNPKSTLPLNNHRRIDTQNLIKYSNPYFNIKLIDEDILRERPFYNRPKEKLPEQKNFQFIRPNKYKANITTHHVEIDTKKKINFDALIEQKEKEKIEKSKEEMLYNQKKIRQIDSNINSKTDKINNFLESMCVYGNVTKMQLKEEKLKHPEKYIDTKQALEKENSDPEIFALGLISSVLEQYDIQTAIETEKGNEDTEDEAITSMQFMTNGLIGRKKYDLYFDLDKGRVLELLTNPKEYNKFKEDLISKLSKDYNIPRSKIIVTFPQKGSLHLQVIFQSDEFNDLDVEELKEKFINDKEYLELSRLKAVHSSLIMEGCKLSIRQIDPRGNRYDCWGINQKRGNEKYIPPIGWIGIGLKVFDEFSNDRWLDMQNIPGEWVVAYHGVGRQLGSKEVITIPGTIYKEGFKKGKGQNHKNCPDYFHPGNLVGEGVYCTPLIKVAEEYAGISEFNGKKYKTVIMVRVNPSARRHCAFHNESRSNIYWVVNGTPDEIRPYRILYKKIDNLILNYKTS